MKPEKDKRFARWLVKVLLPGYYLAKHTTGKKVISCEALTQNQTSIVKE